jgi:hypothetical protein
MKLINKKLKAPLSIQEVYNGNQTRASKKEKKIKIKEKARETLQIAELPRPIAQTLNPPLVQCSCSQ